MLKSKRLAGLAGPAGEDVIMRIPSRLLRRALLASTPFLLGMGAGAQAQDSHAHMDMPAEGPATALKRSRWSDPASWPNGKVPAC